MKNLSIYVRFRFWGDAVLTACYLINRMPSFVLHDQIHHSLLFPDQPLYFLPPRVLVVLALFIFSLLDRTNFLPEPQNAFSWDILNFKRVIVVIPLRLIATFSPLMSLSLRTHRSTPPLSLFLSLRLLLPQFCLLLLTYPLLFGKVIDILVILIPFTIF